MSVRMIGLTMAAACLSACAFGASETATTEPELERFSEMVGVDTETPALSLAAVPEETAPLAEAGSDFLSALFTPTPKAPTDNGHRYGDPVPYGAIEAVCDAPRRPGTQVTKVAGFTIYDSAPGNTALRPHYVTGFDDGCARQFSAALVMTGDVGTHEVVRYMPSNNLSYNKTDSAYEAVKAGFCRVRHGKPCGGRLDALARQTTFITAYQSFGSRPEWVEILLHDGEVTAVDFKTR